MDERVQQQGMKQEQGNPFLSQSAFNDSSFIYRLDTNPLIQDVRMLLSGVDYEAVENEDGGIEYREIKVGDPIINRKGVQAITGLLKVWFNHHIAMSNYTDEEFYEKFAEYAHESLIRLIYTHKVEWGITDNSDANYILDTIVVQVRTYMTNALKAGYLQTNLQGSRLVESNMVSNQEQKKKKLFGVF